MPYFNRNVIYTLLLSTVGICIGCTKKKVTPVDDKFEITDSLIRRLLIDTVQQANNKVDIIFSAKITADEDHKTELFPLVSGTINGVAVKLGDRVSKGQVLATLNSAEMSGFDKEKISAAAELKNAERTLKQTEQLFESGLSSAKEIEESKNNYIIKKAELKRAGAVLTLNGGSKTGSYAIKSPINGFVIEKNITKNMQLRSDNNKNLFTIADLSSVWVLINVYESDVSKLMEGDDVEISILSYPDQQFHGKIDRLYNMIDQESKVMNARVIVSNPNFLLKPGMLGTVKVSSRSGIDLPSVNASAIIFDANKNYVLVLGNDHKVRIQEIKIGRKTANKVYISNGVNAGDRIISSKQVFLFESLKNQ